VVLWIVKVWLICVARRSSWRLLAPGTRSGGVIGGSECRHLTADVYSLRSETERELLLKDQNMPES
jgi:hypothetical protein